MSQTADLDNRLDEVVEDYCSRMHEHVELTLRSVEHPHRVVTRVFHPRDCQCDEKPDQPISDAWLRLFGPEGVTGR